MISGLTPRQRHLLAFLTDEAEAGRSPSFDEMADAIGFASKSGVARLIEALEQRGHVRRHPNRARAIEIIPQDPFHGVTTDDLIAELTRRGIDLSGWLAEQGRAAA